ncbi:hypothetical protein [Capnocytophaga canimorsus]|uniref:Uncharacterized protein n=1 Tax=Capnocytophaga canimorsus (strain 5) TaxID=860228 RepID=F9YSN0_CAPCC|nr:hypothetical protein [Capnocytophaga canimorsus]AEK22703.1 Hypothetical protein Ccan_05830 [Capnocytophaga canimorsus Cc5]
MQTVKIIIGGIIGFFSFMTTIEMTGEARGAELAGVFTAFLVIGGVSG